MVTHRILSLHVIPPTEATDAHLLAISNYGFRFYLTTKPEPYSPFGGGGWGGGGDNYYNNYDSSYGGGRLPAGMDRVATTARVGAAAAARNG